jgi:hypothetical protein
MSFKDALKNMGSALGDKKREEDEPKDDRKEAARAAVKKDKDNKEKRIKLLNRPAMKGAGRFFGGMGASLTGSNKKDDEDDE